MYMANAYILHWGTVSVPVGCGVRGNANFSVHIGCNTSFSIFRYQHVGIGNAKMWRWGSKTTRGPNANGFALQWNIGLINVDEQM